MHTSVTVVVVGGGGPPTNSLALCHISTPSVKGVWRKALLAARLTVTQSVIRFFAVCAASLVRSKTSEGSLRSGLPRLERTWTLFSSLSRVPYSTMSYAIAAISNAGGAPEQTYRKLQSAGACPERPFAGTWYHSSSLCLFCVVGGQCCSPSSITRRRVQTALLCVLCRVLCQHAANVCPSFGCCHGVIVCRRPVVHQKCSSLKSPHYRSELWTHS